MVQCPSFLWVSESTWASNRKLLDVSFDGPELKKELRTNFWGLPQRCDNAQKLNN